MVPAQLMMSLVRLQVEGATLAAMEKALEQAKAR